MPILPFSLKLAHDFVLSPLPLSFIECEVPFADDDSSPQFMTFGGSLPKLPGQTRILIWRKKWPSISTRFPPMPAPAT